MSVNYKPSINKLKQQIDELQAKENNTNFAELLRKQYQEADRRQSIKQSGDSEAIQGLVKLEHNELLVSLKELLQEADWIEDMEQHPDRETGDRIKDALTKARIRTYSIDVTRALNKLLDEDLPYRDYDTQLHERNRAAIKRLRDNQQAFMEKTLS